MKWLISYAGINAIVVYVLGSIFLVSLKFELFCEIIVQWYIIFIDPFGGEESIDQIFDRMHQRMQHMMSQVENKNLLLLLNIL